MDGLSTDGTIQILQKNNHSQWFSEKDNGQSDALNKGFKKATGSIFAWQNADDLYAPDALKIVADFLEAHQDVDIVYGDYQVIGSEGNWICDVHPIEWNQWMFAHGRFVPLQPTLFWRRCVYEGVGELDLNLPYCMDVDFLARACKKGFRFAKIPKILGMFRVHDGSKTQNRGNRIAVEKEYKSVIMRHFKLGLIDRVIFDVFQKRKKIASFVKRKLLPRA